LRYNFYKCISLEVFCLNHITVWFILFCWWQSQFLVIVFCLFDPTRRSIYFYNKLVEQNITYFTYHYNAIFLHATDIHSTLACGIFIHLYAWVDKRESALALTNVPLHTNYYQYLNERSLCASYTRSTVSDDKANQRAIHSH